MRAFHFATLVFLTACRTGDSPAPSAMPASAGVTGPPSAAALPRPDADARELVAIARRDYPAVWACIVAKGEWAVATDGKDHGLILKQANTAAEVCEQSASKLVPPTANGSCAKLAEQSWRTFVGGRAKFQRAWSNWFEKAGLEAALRTKTLPDIVEDDAVFKTMPQDFNFAGAADTSPSELTECIDALVLCNGRACEGEFALVTSLGLRGAESTPTAVRAKSTGEKL